MSASNNSPANGEGSSPTAAVAAAAAAAATGEGSVAPFSLDTIGFAKLQGQDFVYYMQKYCIVLGRNTKNCAVDVDLGGKPYISPLHARIFYDFERHHFSLEVIGKNGCMVQGVHHPPNSEPIKIDSQYLIQIGEKKFFFLLPIRPLFPDLAAVRAGRHQLDLMMRASSSGMPTAERSSEKKEVTEIKREDEGNGNDGESSSSDDDDVYDDEE